ncbi:hypothetical protein FXO38_29048 [Capsicum annuum]|nr:hypothetical protein FXO38_29048 [Capsicum annuum]
MHLREKVNPTIINNDVCVLTYIMDADADGFRPILRINMVERSFEGSLNSSPTPPRSSTVDNNLIDDDLNDYENDDDYPINMEDDSMHMKNFSSDSQDDEEDYGTRSQPRYSFTDGTNLYCEHLYLFYAAAKAYSSDEFSKNFAKLKTNCPEAAHIPENVLGFEKWSRAHFLSNRYDVMTTNITEWLNSVLMDEREYPMLYIFNSIARKFGEKFGERHAFVDVFDDDITAKVNLLERSYSYYKFDLVKTSSEHAMAALRAKYDDDVGYGNFIYEYS